MVIKGKAIDIQEFTSKKGNRIAVAQVLMDSGEVVKIGRVIADEDGFPWAKGQQVEEGFIPSLIFV